jgi:hypothetical protein
MKLCGMPIQINQTSFFVINPFSGNGSRANSPTNLIILTIHTKKNLNEIEIYLRTLNVNGCLFEEVYHFYFSHVEMEALQQI